MSEAPVVYEDGIEEQPLAQFTEKAYLDYSMSVILDRALPHIGDGLKPVQRRIVFAMSELGLKNTAKHKKSARTVGDVLGKYHPHSDQACYEAMVLMAQSFSYRYPLVDGQGNWGSPDDPKSFAAMRYTESRLAPYAEALLSELGQGTVEWTPNFDGTLTEPALLPARLPNVLLNGASGIAVGMATDIPPHNLNEVVSACVHLLDSPKATVEDLCEHIQGPDYPCGAEIITPRADIIAMYKKGGGSVRQRGVYHIEQGEIVVTALPQQVSPAKVLEQIAALMQAKKLPMVADLRDEADHENPVRMVIVPRSNRIELEGLMTHLFATTDLERSYRINLNIIGVDGRPQVKPLNKLLTEWLAFRTQTVTRRLQYRLEKVQDRLHILDSLLIAFLNIDEVIAIIRGEDKPKPILMKRFKLTDTQAEAILELKLRHLAKLEEQKIRAEQNELSDERDALAKILGSKARLKTLVRNELLADAKTFGDKRRCTLIERKEAQALREVDVLPSELVTVVLSEKGWIRAAKGHEMDGGTLNYKAGDAFLSQARGRSNQDIIFLDSVGRSYSFLAHGLPSARSNGEPLTSRLSPPAGAQFEEMLMGEPEQLLLLASDAGYGFITKLEELLCKNKNGKAVLKLPKGSCALRPRLISDLKTASLAAVTNTGRLLVFPVDELPQMARGKGNKILGIPAASFAAREEYVADIAVVRAKGTLVLYAGKRNLKLKKADLEHYLGERGRRGRKLPRGFQKVDAMDSY